MLPSLCFRHAKILPGAFRFIRLMRPSKLNSDTTAMGRFLDVAWYQLNVTKASGRKDTKRRVAHSSQAAAIK